LAWPCTGQPGQRWVLRGDGSLYNPGADRCADVAIAAGVRGNAAVRLAACNGQASQRFVPTADNELRGAAGQCVDHSRGARRVVQMATCDGSDTQAWFFAPPVAPVDDGDQGDGGRMRSPGPAGGR